VHRAFKNYLWSGGKQLPIPRVTDNTCKVYGYRADDERFNSRQDEERRLGLVSLSRGRKEDMLTRCLRSTFPNIWRRRSAHYEVDGVLSLSEFRLRAVVGAINVVVAAGLVFGAIFTLYYRKDPEIRLVILTIYTVAFSAAIKILTTAKPSEIFVASAAYAAVLVVFVSGDIGPDGRDR
jgi:hypothetical protein